MVVEAPAVEGAIDTRQPLSSLFRDLRTSALGLSGREAQQRLIVFGPNELPTVSGRRWPSELRKQVTHPLALVLVVAAVLAWWTGTPVLAAAIVAVIVLNAGFAFVQELQAERAVEALAAYLPARAHVLRDHQKAEVEARTSPRLPGRAANVSQSQTVLGINAFRQKFGPSRAANGHLRGYACPRFSIDLARVVEVSRPCDRGLKPHD